MKINDIIINADLAEVLEELQVQLRQQKLPYLQKTQDSGKDIMVQCPYHGNGQERRPSMGIRKSDGMCHCFACHEVHTLPELISFVFGSDDMFGQYGRKWLLKNFGTVQVEERKDVEIDMARPNATDKNNVLGAYNLDKSQWVSEEELQSYRYYHPYMFERGLKEGIIERFDVGYDIKTDSITFPVRDVYGHTLFIARRSVKYKRFNYPKGVEKPIYGLYELYQNQIKQNDDVFITESMIDCLLLCQQGFNAVAMNGTGSELQYKQLNEIPVRHFVIATDNDSAGYKARNIIQSKVHKLLTYIQFPGDRKDIGECTEEQIKSIYSWEVL